MPGGITHVLLVYTAMLPLETEPVMSRGRTEMGRRTRGGGSDTVKGGGSDTVKGDGSDTVKGGGSGTVTGGGSDTVKGGGLSPSRPHCPTILTEQKGALTHQPRWAGEELARPHVHFTTSTQTRCSGRRRRRRDRRMLKLFLPETTLEIETWLAHSRYTLWPTTAQRLGHSRSLSLPDQSRAAGDTCTSQSC